MLDDFVCDIQCEEYYDYLEIQDKYEEQDEYEGEAEDY